MARFGLYIGLFELGVEVVTGRVNTAGAFVAGGLAGALQGRYSGAANFMTAFMGSGALIGGIGLYMHKGLD